MEDPGFLADERSAALVLYFFLQPDSKDLNYGRELSSKAKELIANQDINHNGYTTSCEDYGELESDGHLPANGSISGCLEDILPLVELRMPGARAEVDIARGLREIAAQVELDAVARAAQNLSRNLSESPTELMEHLVREVERLMGEVRLTELPQERVFMALTFTLVKGVCIQAPHLLRSLFDSAVQFISHRWAR